MFFRIFPQLKMWPRMNGIRILQIHRSVPGNFPPGQPPSAE